MPAGVYLDLGPGVDLTVAQSAGAIREVPHPLALHTTAVMAKQEFWQYQANFARQAWGTAGPVIEGQATYLVDETETRDMGAGIVSWDRVWASLPATFQIPVSITKNYQGADYVLDLNFTPPHVLDQMLVSYTQAIKGVMNQDFYLNAASVGAMPVVPTLMVFKYFSFNALTDLGTGFPTVFSHGLLLYASNNASSFISGTIEPYMGAMMVRKTIYG